MSDTNELPVPSPPTSARKGVTERITAMDTTALSSRGLTGAPQNAAQSGPPATPESGELAAPDTRETPPAKPEKPAKDDK